MTPVVIVHAPLLPDSKPGLAKSCCDVVQPVTVNAPLLVAVPPPVVTEIAPLDEQFGTVALICVALITLNDAAWPLNFTLVAPERSVPVIVTVVPTPPLVGEKPLIVGAGVVDPPPPMNSSYNKRFGDPVPGFFTTPAVAFVVSALATCDGVALGFADKYNADVPQTCGVAIDVPLIVFVAVVLEYHDEVMFTPGAKMSTHVP